MEKLTLTVEEVGKSLGISKPKAYELVHMKRFPKIFLGRRIVVPTQEFYQWLSAESRREIEVR